MLEQVTQSDEGSNQPVEPDCDQIFIQAAGGKNKKKRIYGTGCLSQSKFFDVGSSSTVFSDQENVTIKEMSQKINSQTHELNDLRRQMLEMRALVEQLTTSTRDMFPSSFSHPRSTHQHDSPNAGDDSDDYIS